MGLYTMKEILSESVQKKYAVGAFSGFDLLSVDAVLAAAEEENKPVIFLIHPGFLVQARHDVPTQIRVMQDIIRASKAPATMILDHGSNFKECMECISLGFPSVMFDGSSLSNEENMAATKEIVKAAHACGVTVEAEIGHVGGHEGNADGDVADARLYTKPEEAELFARETGIDALAVAIGTVHGVFRGTPKLDIARLKEIRQAVGDLPLVMHGGSGLPEIEFRMAVEGGINKINFITGMMLDVLKAVRDTDDARHAAGKRSTWWDMLPVAQDTIKRIVKEQMDIFNTQPLYL